jgi:hypothetical protein
MTQDELVFLVNGRVATHGHDLGSGLLDDGVDSNQVIVAVASAHIRFAVELALASGGREFAQQLLALHAAPLRKEALQ